MPYCLPQDVRDLHQLFTEQDFEYDYVQKYIDKATARMNDRIHPHYVVPFQDTVPPIIKSICADMAASLLCQHHFSGINYREDTPLAEVFRKRAETDLEHVLEHSTLDEYPGIVKKQPEIPEMRKRIASTTPAQSPLKNRLKRFENATQAPLASVRFWK